MVPPNANLMSTELRTDTVDPLASVTDVSFGGDSLVINEGLCSFIWRNVERDIAFANAPVSKRALVEKLLNFKGTYKRLDDLSGETVDKCLMVVAVFCECLGDVCYMVGYSWII